MARFLAIGHDGQTFTNLGYLFTFGDDGLDVLTWRTTTTRSGHVMETMQLVGTGTDDEIIAAYNELTAGLELVRAYADFPEFNFPVFLYMNAETEAPKRAFIHSLAIQPVVDGMATPQLGFGQALYTLVIERSAWWEPCTDMHWPDGDGFIIPNAYGTGTMQVERSMDAGDLAGRIASVLFTNTLSGDEATSGNLHKTWLGIRPFRVSTELSSGFVYHGSAAWDATCVDAATTADATAIGGSKVAVGFATQTGLAKRAYANGNPNFAGRYLVLARCHFYRASYPASMHLRMQYGLQETGGGLVPSESVFLEIANANWQWVELGEITVTNNSANRIELWAEQLTSATYLYVDEFVYIPAEIMLKCENVNAGIYERKSFSFSQAENGIQRIGMTSINSADSQFSAPRWEWPRLGGIVVFAGESATDPNALTPNIRIQFSVQPHWSGHRAV